MNKKLANTPREEHIAEMERIKAAMKKTTSPYLKRDYRKAYERKRRQLLYYDQVFGR